jgi:hypothetical protein
LNPSFDIDNINKYLLNPPIWSIPIYLEFLLYNLDIYNLDINKLSILGNIYFDKIYNTIVIIVKVKITSFTK